MAFDQRDIDEINSRLSIVDVIGQYLNVKRSGNSYLALCPFHREKTPSFNINPAKNFYYCFGCGAHGNMFQFLMDYEKITFPDAVKKLAAKAGVTLRESNSAEVVAKKTQIDVILEILRRVTKTFRFFLLKDEHREVRQILRNRKISEEIEELFELGYLPGRPGWLWDFLLEKKYSEEVLRQTGLFVKNGKRSLFEGRLIFPITNNRGEVVAFGGRIIQGEGPKYINSPETSVFLKRKTLYGFFQAQKEARLRREIILTEGYVDVLSLFTADLPFACAPLGTALTNDHFEFLSRFGWRIKLLMDGDSAGLNSAWKAVNLAELHQVSVEVVPLPENCKDAAEVLEKMGAESLKDIASSTRDPLQYLLPRLSGFQENRSEGVKKAFSMVQELLSNVKTQVRKDIIIESFSNLTRLNPDSVKTDLMSGKKNASTDTTQTAVELKNRDFLMEWILVGCILAHPEKYIELRQIIIPEDLTDPTLQKVLKSLDSKLGQHYNLSGQILEEIKETLPDVLLEDLNERLKRGEYDHNPDAIIQDGARRIKLRKVLGAKKAIQDKLESLQSADQMDLLETLKFLDQEISQLKGAISEN